VPRIGEILVAKGVLNPEALRSGLDAARRNGGRVGTWLVRLGYINEASLLEALSQQFGCPVARTIDLATAPLSVRSLLPTPFCKRHVLLPFNRSGRQLDVAMVNPSDLAVIDEMSRNTGLIVRPYVATEAALTAALALTAPPASTATSPPPAPNRTATREWRQFWKMEAPTIELQKAMTAISTPPVAFLAATFPYLAPLGSGIPVVVTDGADDLAEAFSAATHRDQVASLILGNLAAPGRRVATFSVQHGKVMGWAATGLGVQQEEFHTLILTLDRPSVFLETSKGSELHVGPVGPGEHNKLLVEALGAPQPRESILTSLRVRGKLAGFLWVDRGEEKLTNGLVALAQEVARLAGLALEILVLRQKIRAGARLTEGVQGD
jgi:GAF domain-containing protein